MAGMPAPKPWRSIVSCIRDFPKGCGRDALPIDRKSKDDAPLPPPPPPQPSVCYGFGPLEEKPPANGTVEVVEPSPMVVVEKSLGMALSGKAVREEPAELACPSECRELQPVEPSACLGTPAAPEIEERGIGVSSEQAEKSQPPEVLKDSSDRLEMLDAMKTDGVIVELAESSDRERGDAEKEVRCYLKLYPSRRRALSAVRDFPAGCGRNAPPLMKEKGFKLPADSSLPRIKIPHEERTLEVDQQPAQAEGLPMAEVPADMLVDTVTRSSCEAKKTAETVEEVCVNMTVAADMLIEGSEESKKTVETVEKDYGTMEVPADILVYGREKSNDANKAAETTEKVHGAIEGPGDMLVEGVEKKSETKKPAGIAEVACGIVKVPVDMLVEKVEKENEAKKTAEIAGEISVKALVRPISTPKNMRLESENKTIVKQPGAVKGNVLAEKGKQKMFAGSSLKNKLEGHKKKPVDKSIRITKVQKDKHSNSGSHSGNKLTDMEGKIPVGRSTDKLPEKPQQNTNIMKRKFSDNVEYNASINENMDAQTLDANGEKLVVQGLMASQNCPWRHGRKSGASCSRTSAQKAKMKSEGASPVNQPAIKELEDEEDTFSQCEEDERALTVYQGSSIELSVILPPVVPPVGAYSGSVSEDAAARLKVKNALRLFHVVYRKLLHGEEAKSKGEQAKSKGKPGRADLEASGVLKKESKWVNTGKPILGHVPGVEVGDEFLYRVELSIVGLHRPFQGGIDSLKINGVYVATSIVASGGYPDDMDSSGVLIYSGSGGNPASADKPPEDQKLERGNLALKNSIDSKTPVRVIHGFKAPRIGSSGSRSKLVSTFTYDGLYFVEEYWKEKGLQGFSVFKFKLRRMPGQPELALHQAKMSKKSKVREGLLVKDISEGKEKIPICVVNTFGNDHPQPFNYIMKMKYPSWYSRTPPKGCDCKNGCTDSEKCSCAVRNGGEIPYNYNGDIVHAKRLVYECGPSCKCPPGCHNRVSQKGVRIPLEIFKTKSMGWGVRSLDSIPSGTFICEYIGELLQDKEAEKRSNDEYLFDIGHNYDDHSLWEGLPALIPGMESDSTETLEDMGFTIDAAEYGNVGRFINHSCSPNLYAQNVLYDHDDMRTPHIMFFAAENIPPLQELTYHYNYMIDQVYDAEGNIKKKACYCGSPECTGRLY